MIISYAEPTDDPKPIRKFFQLDAWAGEDAAGVAGNVFTLDGDGDLTLAGIVNDPHRSGTTVRVMVADQAAPADVIRVLRKLLAWVERDDAAILTDDYWKVPSREEWEEKFRWLAGVDEPPF